MCTFEIAMRSTERRKSPILSSPIGFSSPFSQLRCGMHVYEPLNARTTTTLIAPLYRDGCTYVRTTRMYNISSCLVTSFTSAKKKPLPSHLPYQPPTHLIYPSFLYFIFFPHFCRRRRDRVASRNGGRKKKILLLHATSSSLTIRVLA
jgi:hypothetical protein